MKAVKYRKIMHRNKLAAHFAPCFLYEHGYFESLCNTDCNTKEKSACK